MANRYALAISREQSRGDARLSVSRLAEARVREISPDCQSRSARRLSARRPGVPATPTGLARFSKLGAAAVLPEFAVIAKNGFRESSEHADVEDCEPALPEGERVKWGINGVGRDLVRCVVFRFEVTG